MSWNNDDTMDLAQFDDDFVSADVEERTLKLFPTGNIRSRSIVWN